MGILDDLGGSGILEFLRNNALNQNLNAGLTPDQSGYSQAPFSLAPAQQLAPQAQQPAAPMQQPAPVQKPAPDMSGAPSNAMAAMPQQPIAQPASGPPPAVAPVAAVPQPAAPLAAPAAPAPFSMAGVGDGAGDRLMKGTRGFIGNLHNGPIGAIAGGLGALVTGQSTDPGSIAADKALESKRAQIAGLQANGVSNVDITAALANPEYMKRILDANVKDKGAVRPATADERKAAFGDKDTGQPLYLDATGKPTFGPAQTNVNVSTEKTGQAELMKQAVDAHVTAQGAARESQKRLGLYDSFEKAAQGFTPGASAEARLTAKRYLKDAGLIKGDDVPDGEVMQMISRSLAVHAQPKGQGAVSNFERELFAKSLPNMTQSPEGLRQAIGIQRKLEQFDMNVATIYRDSARANKGLPNYLEVQDKIAALGSPLGDADMAAIQSGSGAPPAAAPKPAAAKLGAAKPATVTQGGHTYVLQPDGTYQ